MESLVSETHRPLAVFKFKIRTVPLLAYKYHLLQSAQFSLDIVHFVHVLRGERYVHYIETIRSADFLRDGDHEILHADRSQVRHQRMRGTNQIGLEEHDERRGSRDHDSERKFRTEIGDPLYLLHVRWLHFLQYRCTYFTGQSNGSRCKHHLHTTGVPCIEIPRCTLQPYERDHFFPSSDG